MKPIIKQIVTHGSYLYALGSDGKIYTAFLPSLSYGISWHEMTDNSGLFATIDHADAEPALPASQQSDPACPQAS